MAQILPWVALVLAGLVLGHGVVRGGGEKTPLLGGLQPFLLAAVGLLVIGALATLPAGSPWSPGQGLWPGFLLGGAGVMAAGVVGRRARFAAEGGEWVAAASRVAAATSVLALFIVLYPVFRHSLLVSLGGMALGALTCGLLLSGLALSGEDTQGAGEAAQSGALTLLALTTATFLAAFHQDAAGVREWLALPAVLGATGAAALTARGILGTGSPLLTLVVVGAPTLLMAWLLGYQLKGTPAFFFAVLIGLAAFSVVAWLERSEDADATPTLRADVGLLAALVLLGGAALAFRERQGYGVALAGVCGALVWGASGSRSRSSVLLPGGVVLLLLIALYRVFTETNAYTRGFQPDFLYFYVALVAGALLPALLAGSAFRTTAAGTSQPGAAGALARLGLAGGTAVVAPLAVRVLVGERPQAAMLVGLAVGAGFLLSRQVTGARPAAETGLAGLLALLAGWVTIQFTHLLAPLAMGTRMQRITVLAVLGALGLVVVVVTALVERSGSGTPDRQRRAEPG